LFLALFEPQFLFPRSTRESSSFQTSVNSHCYRQDNYYYQWRTPPQAAGYHQTHFEEIVGWVEVQSADTHRGGTMGIAESILSQAEGLNPSYAGIAAQQAAGN